MVTHRCRRDTDDGTLDVSTASHSGDLTTVSLTTGSPDPSSFAGQRAYVVGADGASLLATHVVAASSSSVTLFDPDDVISGLSADARFVITTESDWAATVRDDTTVVQDTTAANITFQNTAGQAEIQDFAVDFVASGVAAGDAILCEYNFGGGDIQYYWAEVVSVSDPAHIFVTIGGDMDVMSLPALDAFWVFGTNRGSAGLTAVVGASATFNGGTYTQVYCETDVDTSVVGWYLLLNAATPKFCRITSASGRIYEVEGDVRNLVASGDIIAVRPPFGVDESSGAVITDQLDADIRCPWAGGFHLTTPIETQSGANTGGEFHFWNRLYSPTIGRWTTPDPAATPWTNLFDYVGCRPISRRDYSGLNDPTGRGGPAPKPKPKAKPPVYGPTLPPKKKPNAGDKSNGGWGARPAHWPKFMPWPPYKPDGTPNLPPPPPKPAPTMGPAPGPTMGPPTGPPQPPQHVSQGCPRTCPGGTVVGDGWCLDSDTVLKAHPGAGACFRGYGANSGKQCCYTSAKKGSPPAWGEGAGTEDLVGSAEGENADGSCDRHVLGTIGHYFTDVCWWFWTDRVPRGWGELLGW